jgi:hypothetical protein
MDQAFLDKVLGDLIVKTRNGRKPDPEIDHLADHWLGKPTPAELIQVAMPIFAAEAVVAIVVLLGAAITVRGHALLTIAVGWFL